MSNCNLLNAFDFVVTECSWLYFTCSLHLMSSLQWRFSFLWYFSWYAFSRDQISTQLDYTPTSTIYTDDLFEISYFNSISLSLCRALDYPSKNASRLLRKFEGLLNFFSGHWILKNKFACKFFSENTKIRIKSWNPQFFPDYPTRLPAICVNILSLPPNERAS